jgi:broad specificity phosphatase PhoE
LTTTFHLVRHAAHGLLDGTLCGRMPDVHLSEEGRWQAEWVATLLSREAVAAIHCSPRERARETAEPIAHRLGLPITTSAEIDEWDAGDWTGKRFDALRTDPAWQSWNLARAASRPPGGETAIAVQARVVGLVLDLAAIHDGSSVVLVSHAEPLRSLILHALGLGPDSWSRIELAPASLTTIVIGDWGCRLKRLNESPPA